MQIDAFVNDEQILAELGERLKFARVDLASASGVSEARTKAIEGCFVWF